MHYISVSDAAKKWNVSERSVRNYCAEGRVYGAVLVGKIWMIPEEAVKPMRISGGKKTEEKATALNVLSLFSGCGGMDLGFEGGFTVL